MPAFNYLVDVATRYGNMYVADEFKTFIAEASAKELEELGQVYEEIERREDTAEISRWIDRCHAQRSTDASAFRLSCSVQQLFVLFQFLANSGIAPFSSREVSYV